MYPEDQERLERYNHGLTEMGLPKLETVIENRAWYLKGDRSDGQRIAIALITYDSDRPFDQRFEITAVFQ